MKQKNCETNQVREKCDNSGTVQLEDDTKRSGTEVSDQLEADNRIDVFWPLDNQFYSRTVRQIDSNGYHVLMYNDGDVDTLILMGELWRQIRGQTTSNVLRASLNISLTSNEQYILSDMMDTFGNKAFSKQHAREFDQYAIVNAHREENSHL